MAPKTPKGPDSRKIAKMVPQQTREQAVAIMKGTIARSAALGEANGTISQDTINQVEEFGLHDLVVKYADDHFSGTAGHKRVISRFG